MIGIFQTSTIVVKKTNETVPQSESHVLILFKSLFEIGYLTKSTAILFDIVNILNTYILQKWLENVIFREFPGISDTSTRDSRFPGN